MIWFLKNSVSSLSKSNAINTFFIVHIFSLKVPLSQESNKLINQFLLQAVITKSYLEQNRILLVTLSFPLFLQIRNLWLINIVAHKMILFFKCDNLRKNNIQQSDSPLRQWSLKFYWNLQLLKIVLKDTLSSWGPLKYNISSKQPFFFYQKIQILQC